MEPLAETWFCRGLIPGPPNDSHSKAVTSSSVSPATTFLQLHLDASISRRGRRLLLAGVSIGPHAQKAICGLLLYSGASLAIRLCRMDEMYCLILGLSKAILCIVDDPRRHVAVRACLPPDTKLDIRAFCSGSVCFLHSRLRLVPVGKNLLAGRAVSVLRLSHPEPGFRRISTLDGSGCWVVVWSECRYSLLFGVAAAFVPVVDLSQLQHPHQGNLIISLVPRRFRSWDCPLPLSVRMLSGCVSVQQPGIPRASFRWWPDRNVARKAHGDSGVVPGGTSGKWNSKQYPGCR